MNNRVYALFLFLVSST